jgi:hypothetical protein
MQIHEITLRPLDEGILRTIGQDIKGAVTEPFQKLKTIANTPGAWTSGTTAAAALDQRERAQADLTVAQQQQQRSAQVLQQTQQRAKQLAQQWAQQVKAMLPATPTGPTAPFAGRSAPLPTVTVSGNLLTKGPDGFWYSEDGRAETDPKTVEKLNKLYYTGQRNVKGTVREATGEYTTDAGIVVPGGSKTDQSQSTVNKKFIDWSDQQLTSVIPGTRQEINMDMVRKDPELSQSVKAAQDKVSKDPNNIQAVEDYFETAMQAMQQLSARIKQSARPARGGTQAGGVLGRVLDQSQLDKLKGLLQNPQLASQVKTELGIQ